MSRDMNKVILTDVDGVLLNWEYAFDVWIREHGYERQPNTEKLYDMSKIYGVSDYATIKKYIKMFNESAAIGFLPPLRDAIHYVQKLHREHGYVFHVISSLSVNSHAQLLRTQNLKKLFGETVFEKFVYLDTGADKHDALKPYLDSGLIWVEDKKENAEVGRDMGLDSILMEHGHNMNHPDIRTVKNWKEIYEYVIGP